MRPILLEPLFCEPSSGLWGSLILWPDNRDILCPTSEHLSGIIREERVPIDIETPIDL